MAIENNTTGLQNVIALINELPEFHEPHLQDKNITPSASVQIVVADVGYDGLSRVTVEGDSNLVSDNIKSGVSIFGVNGSQKDVATEILNKTISGTYSNNEVINIGKYAFESCSSLTSVNFPACTNIESHAFKYCSSLASVNFPACTNIGSFAFHSCISLVSASFPVCATIGSSAFTECISLPSVDFPACTSIEDYAFSKCSSLESVNFPACTSIGVYAFASCYSLKSVNFPACSVINNGAFSNCYFLELASFPKCSGIFNSAFGKCHYLISLYLTSSSLCTLKNSIAFNSTPIGGYSASAGCYGSIYVPQSLLASYKAATNWTYFSSRFVGV